MTWLLLGGTSGSAPPPARKAGCCLSWEEWARPSIRAARTDQPEVPVISEGTCQILSPQFPLIQKTLSGKWNRISPYGLKESIWFIQHMLMFILANARASLFIDTCGITVAHLFPPGAVCIKTDPRSPRQCDCYSFLPTTAIIQWLRRPLITRGAVRALLRPVDSGPLSHPRERDPP